MNNIKRSLLVSILPSSILPRPNANPFFPVPSSPVTHRPRMYELYLYQLDMRRSQDYQLYNKNQGKELHDHTEHHPSERLSGETEHHPLERLSGEKVGDRGPSPQAGPR